jgi:disintegrin and metalloproteinase domain-containing protein 10
LTDDDESVFEGVITANGLIDGYIKTTNEEYYIEPAERYFDTKDFHSIIYLLSAVVFPTINKSIYHYFYNNNDKVSEQQSCCCSNSSNINEKTSDDESEYFSSSDLNSRTISISHNKVKNRSDKEKKQRKDKPINYLFSQLITDSVNKRRTNRFDKINISGRKKRDSDKKGETVRDTYYNDNNDRNKPYYWKDVDSLHYSDSEPYGVRAVQRTHWTEDRHDRHVVIDPKKTTCMLYLQADHLFYEKMGSDEACIEAMTRHVQKVNSIYKTTGEEKIFLDLIYFSDIKTNNIFLSK